MAVTGVTRTCTIGAILDALDRSGGSAARVFKTADVSPRLMEDPRRLIMLKDQFALLDATAREIGDPAVAAQMSVAAGIDGLGAYGYHIVSQPTLRDALHVSRTMLSTALQTATRVGLTIEGRWALWSYEVDDAAVIGRRQNDLLCVGYMLEVFRRFGGSRWLPHNLTIPGARIEGRPGIEAIFGCSLSLGATMEMVFPVDLLDARNLAPLAPRRFDPLPAGRGLPTLVAQAILSSLGTRRPDLQRTARRLCLAPRTLQRRLHEHGTTFERVLDRVLAEEAQAAMSGPASLTEIAYDLGFTDPAHFSRAFRRWTGHAPTSWRRNSAN